MKTLIPIILVLAPLLALRVVASGFPDAPAPALNGRIYGLPASGPRLVDLRARLYDAPAGGAAIAEYRFASVRLSRGRFSVPLDRTDLPCEQVYVELALRSAERRYAAFTVLEPRRRLRWIGENRWQAHWRTGAEVTSPGESPATPLERASS